jgi:hypothetical protein
MSSAPRGLSEQEGWAGVTPGLPIRATLSRREQQFLDGVAWTVAKQGQKRTRTPGLGARARRYGVALLAPLERWGEHLLVEDETGTVVALAVVM